MLSALWLSAGCNLPARMVWSPDGAMAAYCVEGKSYLIDDRGRLVGALGESMGGFAWPEDSQSLYFATKRADQDETPLAEVRRDWLAGARSTATRITANKNTSPPVASVINVWRAGEAKPLFALPAAVWRLELSPDGRWLAAAGFSQAEYVQYPDVYVYSLESGRLYLVGERCGIPLCFTDAGRLAYVEVDPFDPADETEPPPPGRLVELTLDEDAAAARQRTTLLEPDGKTIQWVQAVRGGLILTARPADKTPRPRHGGPRPAPCTMYRRTAKEGGKGTLEPLAENVGPLFAVSPDGRRVLFEKSSPPQVEGQPEHRALAVMNVAAGGADSIQELRDLTIDVGTFRTTEMAMWPAWCGNDKIAFTETFGPGSEPRPDKDNRLRLDVVLYQLTADGLLQPLRTLSQRWDKSMKPAISAAPPAPPAGPG
jgi:hypothetical protein